MRRAIHAHLLVVAAVAAFATTACSATPASTPNLAATSGGPGAVPPISATAAPSTGSTTSAGGGDATAARACDLLSDADIKEVTGVAMKSKADNVVDTIYGNHCRWTLEIGEINLGVVAPGGKDYYDTRVAIINPTPIDGLAADVATKDRNTGSIYAVKGDTFFDLFTIGITPPDEGIATRVLQNLGS